MVVTTSDSDEHTMHITGLLSAFETIVIKGSLEFCGFSNVTHKNCFAVSMISDNEREKYLQEIARIVHELVD